MFTNKDHISQHLESRGYAVDAIEYINKGVMTDKYLVISSKKRYIARCYPSGREWLAKTEFLYLNYFRPLGIKVPKPLFYSESPAILFYEELQGESLDNVYEGLSEEEKDTLCQEIIDNFKKICSIESHGLGRMTGNDEWTNNTWNDFLNETIDKGYGILQQSNRTVACDYVKDMRNSITYMTNFRKALVWSDFCQENIIVTQDHHLAGFVDIEGLISGDPHLAIGYLKAHDISDFPDRIIRYGHYESNRIDFYAVFRYLGLLPYQDQDLPNGAVRESVVSFLSYSHKIIEDKSWISQFKRKCMRITITIVALALNIAICLFSALSLEGYYQETLYYSNIVVENKAKNIQYVEDSPSWFRMTKDSLYSCKVVSDNDKRVLTSLVSREDSLYQQYAKSVDELAYKSNNNPGIIYPLFMLTLVFVSLGCCALTFFDYIGHMCYLKDQDMMQWWPWYVFRPLIGIPLASLLIVAVHTAMFSNVFTSGDLNTYAVVSFLVGFAMMEFLKMLRRLGKSLFGGQNQ